MAASMADRLGQMMPVCVCFLLLVLGSAATSKPETFVLCNKFDQVVYVHEDRVPPGETTVTSASPSGTATRNIALGIVEFGTVDTLDNIIREGQSNTSAPLGFIRGLAAIEKDISFYVTLLFQFTKPGCTGTLTTQGILTSDVSGELAITGGTGIFRRARGYVGVSTVVAGPPNFVYRASIEVDYL